MTKADREIDKQLRINSVYDIQLDFNTITDSTGYTAQSMTKNQMITVIRDIVICRN